ncbi:bifunctional 3-oxoadipate enol-lactonase/4-carboxymuconolactone decarboxylase PcaDC [Nonomuraea rhodomycinica]|uniref:4-carboxymuconolactone decarboxylase n=1 Tax=Nonomuraea rhodomycinica TaxID=1712872 RepID=A0A7Y6IRY1_9ACTN|nr:4-carboxymuconolactone decarboxylase [Nonomuraea rhodomycinica]NUW42024.1 4-carboxymuconolactone decarboxylase [Nonomuraea rhodomycinica]
MTLLRHRLDGPEGGPPLVLGPSLGTSARVWEPQLAALSRTFRVLRYELPGHGGSPAPATATAMTIDGLAEHVLELAGAAGMETFHYAGVSIGGAVGAVLAARHPGRVRTLALICSSARFGEPEAWRQRARLVRERGTAALLEGAAGRWFAGPADRALLDDLAATDPGGYAACCDALAAYDLRRELGGIDVPTLVVAGRNDPATPPAHARELADGIPGATLVEVPGAAHLANVDQPGRVTAALLAHLPQPRQAPRTPPPRPGTPEPAQTLEELTARGMRVRREVLGDEHVDRAAARTTPFTRDFQDFITRYAWGGIWTRPGLDRRTRSCVTLAALVARGHLDELALHVRAALRNGLTPDEIAEVLLQTAVYCGVPAANAAFAVARRVLSEEPGAPATT